MEALYFSKKQLNKIWSTLKKHTASIFLVIN